MNLFDSFDIKGALAWLDGHVNLEKSGPVPGAAEGIRDPDRRMRHLNKMMELMGDPQHLYPSIHLTGTNGKTSTARIVTALLLAQGLRTGTYTSPHLERVNERININGEAIVDEDLAEVLHSVALVEPLVEERVSYFELMTAAAFRHFADAPVDVAVIEVGVGGRHDATNIINSTVSVITNIGLDHVGYLGNTRESVADHKADIIKPGSSAVIGEPDAQFIPTWEARRPKALAIFGRDFGIDSNQLAVGGRLLDIRTPLARYDDLFLALHGSFQGKNAAVAVAAVEAFFEQPLSEEVVRAGLAAVTSPGRMEVVNRLPLMVLDGAHNEAGAAALAATLGEEFSAVSGRILVVGMLKGHDPKTMLPALNVSEARLVIAVTPPSPRAVPAEEVARAASDLGVETLVIPDIAEAVEAAIDSAADEELILVTGSLYTVGAARAAIRRRAQKH